MMTQEAILYYADHPADFVEDLLHVTPDKNQRAILDSVAKNQMTSVRSGHGIGKSAVEAWTVIWFMSTRPFPKIPCTAPTQHQLFDILWAEISKWLRNNKALERELMWTKEKVYMKQYPEEWFAVARTASKRPAGIPRCRPPLHHRRGQRRGRQGVRAGAGRTFDARSAAAHVRKPDTVVGLFL